MDYILHILIMISIFAILGLSFNLILGYTGLIAMCHAAFFAIGAYTSALLGMHFKINFLLGIAAAMIVTGAVSLLVAIPAIRVRDEYLIVTTLALLMIVYTVLMNWIDLTRGAAGLSGIPRPSLFGYPISTPTAFIPLMIGFAVIVFMACWRVVHSPFGRVLQAIREDEVAAESLGKNVRAFKIWIFVTGGALAAIAGSLFAHYMTYISPANFTIVDTTLIFAVVIIGGTGKSWGPVVGAATLVSVMEVLRFMEISPVIVGFTRQIAYGAILILFMCFRPQGFLGTFATHPRKDGEKPASLRRGDQGKIPSEGLGEKIPGLFQAGGRPESPEKLLELTGVSKNFGGLKAVNHCTMDLSEGEIVGLIGPNGAGKTTLFNVITGFYSPDTGSVSFAGKDISALPAYRITHLGIARSFQDLRLFHNMTVLDNVVVARPRQTGENLLWAFLRFGQVSREEKENREKALGYLQFVGLADKTGELAGNLSFAEQKLLSLARLLATEAQLILLDEPASGLDQMVMENLFPLVKDLVKFGKTICIVEHNMEVIKAMVDEIVFLNEGKVLARGTPEQIMNTPELAEIYFGG
ncbi:MAG TPA: branched-chain amino acid ABC transporter ATP-binding protein/permease [Thermodesulfobacteriota bacterium]|nr:branched-chain amino acid ABC transporter ATP-binding protein/permease [Thermodesulfobacteriota bacterium]